jgi:proteasome lid subunit RPN8/RPN11
MTNVARGHRRYRVSDREHLELRRVLRTFVPPLEIVGVYHSHPNGDAVPSETDRAEAFYPDWLYLVVGLGSPRVQLRAFRIRHGRVREQPLT